MLDDQQGDLFASPARPAQEGAFDAQMALPIPSLPVQEALGTIIKRDGRKEPFDKTKIAGAIFKAACSVGGRDRDLAESLASAVAIYLGKRGFGVSASVDHVHDAVERVLIQMAHAKTALAYARYRDRRGRIRRLRGGDMRALIGELEEARHERESGRGAEAQTLLLRTSADTLTSWDRQKIIDALVRETGLDRALAGAVALEVERQIQRAGITTLTASFVREMVGAKLIEYGLAEYRDKQQRLGVPLYDTHNILRGATPETVGRDPVATDLVLARAMKKEYALSQVFSTPVAEAHLRGELHLHHLERVDRMDSTRQSIEYISRFGIALPGSGAFAAPPKHAGTLLAQLVKHSAALQGYFADTVEWEYANIFIAPYLHGRDEEELAQFAQMLLYEFAYNALAHGDPAPPTVLRLYWTVPEALKNAPAIGPGGAAAGKTYGDYEHTAQQFAWALIDLMRRTGLDGVRFPSPILEACLGPATLAAPGYDRFLNHIAEVGAQRNAIRFAFERQAPPRPRAAPPWQTHHAVLQQITINLPRVACHAGKESALLDELTRLVHLAAAGHQEKREFIEGLFDERGNGPLSMLAREREEKPLLELAHAVGVIAVEGLNECVQLLIDAQPHASEEAAALGRRILAHLRARCAELSGGARPTLALGQNNDEKVSRRFATLDAQLFPKTTATIVKVDPETQALHYTTGARVNRLHKLNPIEGARIEGSLQHYLEAGAATTVALPEKAMSAAAIADFIKKTYHQTEVQRLSFQ